jgi:hypothetical protein
MKKLTLKQIKSVHTLEDLKALDIGPVVVDIGHRGGGLGFRGADVAEFFGVPEYAFGRNFGAACNYLGGGVRGSIFFGGFGVKYVENKQTAKLIQALGETTVRVYKNLEDESRLNNEQYEDGDTNWDAIATRKVRKSGVRSAY